MAALLNAIRSFHDTPNPNDINMDNKYCHLKSFISSTQEYAEKQNEESAVLLQRNLGVISATVDPSIFDPNSCIVTEFYTSLYNLMRTLNSKSPLMWNAVDVLQTACKNTTARRTLIHTYQFLPILTKLLEDDLSIEKQIQALRIIEELTFGIKIRWQEAHLPSLISNLTKWIFECSEEEIICLALGVLINICYKNLAVIYTFMNSVNAKLFTNKLLKMKPASEESRIKICKFLIILENMGKNLSEKMVLQFVTVTFNSIIPALKNRDAQVLRHIVEFYTNVKSNEQYYVTLKKYESYEKNLIPILHTLENTSNAECVGLMMEFFTFIVTLGLPELHKLYPSFIKLAMKWAPVEQISSQALSSIKHILIDVKRNNLDHREIVEILELSVLLLAFNINNDMSESRKKHSGETINRFSELLQVLEELSKYSSVKTKIIQKFSTQTMQSILRPIISATGGDESGNYLQADSSSMCILALSLISNLASDNTLWMELYNDLLQTRQVQMNIAHALFVGDKLIKEKIFSLSSKKYFCEKEVAACMKELEPLLVIQSGIDGAMTLPDSSLHHFHPEQVPLFSYIQKERLDAFLEKAENIFESGNMNPQTSAVMELYEYELASMRHSEKALQNSLQAAGNYATSLQQRLTQVNVASKRLHELLFYKEQCLEGYKTRERELLPKIEAMEAESKKVHAQTLKQIAGQEEVIQELKATIQQQKETIETQAATIQEKIDENSSMSKTMEGIFALLKKQQSS